VHWTKPYIASTHRQQDGTQYDHTRAQENGKGHLLSQEQNRQAGRDKGIEVIDRSRHGGTDFLDTLEPKKAAGYRTKQP
jgi:hypothetical protein